MKVISGMKLRVSNMKKVNTKNYPISVIIPYYNGSQTILKCLKALDQQKSIELFEVILIDDSGKKDFLKIKYTPHKFILKKIFQKHKGQSAATNAGIKSACGKYVLLFAQDMIASPTLLEEHISTHKKINNLGLAVLGYMPFHPDMVRDNFHDFLMTGPQFDFSNMKDQEFVASANYFYAPNISLRRDFLLNNGLFDEDLVYGYQDIELGRRLESKGLKIFFNKQALAYHWHVITLKSFCEKQVQMGKQARILHQKYPEFKNLEHEHFLKTILNKKQIPILVNRFLESVDLVEKEVVLVKLIQLILGLKDPMAERIGQTLQKFIGKIALAQYLNPIFYRINMFFYFSQGYFKR